MKKYIISSVLLFTMLGLSFADGDNNPESRFPDNLEKHLYSKVGYPETAFENKIEGYVAILFEVNQDGLLVIKETSANDPTLGQHVKDKLQDIRLCPFDLSVGNTYSITFYFNLV